MLTPKSLKRALSELMAISLLTACGGGGGSSSSDNGTPDEGSPGGNYLSGRFVDSPVKGLRYQTPSHSSLTNAQGEFWYLEGETITFFLGNTELGTAEGSELVTPFTLVGLTPLRTEAQIVAALTPDSVGEFDRAINIATLLQSFDVDGNPDNGIDLGNADRILQNDTIELAVKANVLERQADLSQAKAKCKITINRRFSDSIKHLYQSLDITVTSSLVSRHVSETDTENSQAISYEYDQMGRMLEQKVDLDNDGVIDATTEYRYDSRDNLIHISDSSAQTSETLSYNSSNQLRTHLIEQELAPDILQTYTYSNNRLSRLTLDYEADGHIESTTNYSYDSEGNLLSYLTESNGVADAVATYTYSDNRVTSYNEDNNNDGTPDLIITYAYDENGNRLSQQVELTSDGTPNGLGTFEYDANNNVIAYQLDRNLDGVADYLESSVYDHNNNQTLFRRDLNADGTWDMGVQYGYDADGNRISMIEDSNGDGVVDHSWTGNYETLAQDNDWERILARN